MIITDMKNLLLGFCLYAGWFGCVYLGSRGLGLYALAIPLAAWLLFILLLSPPHKVFLKSLLLIIPGLIADSLFLHFHLIRVVPESASVFLPLWMVSLWLLFVPAIVLLKQLFAERYLVAAVAGAVLGPLCYKSGAAFGVLFLFGFSALALYAVFWGLYMPFVLYAIGDNANGPHEAARHDNSEDKD